MRAVTVELCAREIVRHNDLPSAMFAQLPRKNYYDSYASVHWLESTGIHRTPQAINDTSASDRNRVESNLFKLRACMLDSRKQRTDLSCGGNLRADFTATSRLERHVIYLMRALDMP